MAKKQTKTNTSSKLIVEHRGPSIFEVAHQIHHTVAGYCDYCGRPMTPSDVNDYGTLCERCYMKEHVSANNQQTAYFKVKRMYPMAERIVLNRTVHQY